LLEHPHEDLLLSYALAPSDVAEAAALEAHLAACAPCRKQFADIREDDALMAENYSWPEGWDELPLDAPRRKAAAARDRREDAEAEAMLSGRLERFLAESSDAFVWADIARKREYHTGGVVRKLADAADQAQYSVPRRALLLAETAYAIVGMLSTATYTSAEIAALRGLAWKQRANANRQLGRFVTALEALDGAERAYRELRLPELDLASITFIRATIHAEQQRYDLAERWAEESSAAFAQLGQTELYFRSRHLQGWIAFEQRQLGQAQLIFDTVFAYGEASGDLAWLARGSQALGNCYLERRDFARASQYLHRSMLAFRKLGLVVEEIRSRWGLALVVQRDGRYRGAIPQLRDVREEFANLGAVSDAALVTLDLMETFLLLGKPREVRRTAGNIVKLFKDAGMVTGALAAADYLKQAAAMSRVTPTLIEYTRKYLRRVDLQPDLVFVPPAAM
jgi:tetratricopeptide (TPR) repeat protein